MHYTDVEIRILPLEANGYPVEFTVGGEREPGRGRLSTAKPPAPSDNHYVDADYGQALFQWFFADPALARTWAKIRGAHPLRRVCLHIDPGAAELHTVPWEALCESPEDQRPALHLAAASATPFSRYLPAGRPPGRPTSQRPIRILVVAPAQVDFAETYLARFPDMALIDPQQEFAALQAALQPAIDRQQVELTLLEQPCSLARIDQALRQGYHGLHLICHGRFSPERGRAALLLAGDDNRVERVLDEAFAAMLGQQLRETGNGDGAALRLVFLASCESGKLSSAEAYRGLAPQLLLAGAPAVVAMQDLVGDKTAREFAWRFYESLLRHGQIDLACNEARQGLLAARLPGPVIPLLFLGTRESRLLQPDPNWSALRDALASLLEQETFADVADSSSRYLRLPVELAPVDLARTREQPVLLRGPAPAGVLFADAVRDVCREQASGLVLVTGYYGSNLTTQLKRFAWTEMDDAQRRFAAMVAPELNPPEPGQGPLRLPLFANLSALREGRTRYPADPVVGLALNELNNPRSPSRPWPGLAAARLANLLEKGGLELLLVLDDDDTLSEREERDFQARVVEFTGKAANRNHLVVLAVRPPSLAPGGPFSGQSCSVLAVQRMERRKIRHFLLIEAREHDWARHLLQQLDRSAYFDLLAVPWFLFRVVEQSRQGFCPRSRTEVIATIVDDAIDGVVRDIASKEPGQRRSGPAAQGLEEHARQVVYELAWRMQSNYTDTLPLADVLAEVERQRGLRHYSAEAMYHALVKGRLLAPNGSDSVRFAYQGIRGYCCAKAILRQPDSVAVLEHVMAGVGRLTRLRWWEDTLVFACGLMAGSPEELSRFLRVIVYGMDPQDNEQVFLAARCVSESTHSFLALGPEGQTATHRDLRRLAEVIAAALMWRLDSRGEPRSSERRRAAELLGQITFPPRVRELVQVAYREARWDRHDQKALEHSDVRMAAVASLLKLSAEERLKLLQTVDKRGVLAAMLAAWVDGQVDALAGRLHEGASVAEQGIAALALGDLYGRLVLGASPDDQWMASQALNALTAQFQNPATHDDTMWALTYALSMIDLPTVRRALVEGGLWAGVGDQARALPLSSETEETNKEPERRVAAFFREWSERGSRKKFLAYLIGLTQWREQPALDFLREQCLRQNLDQCMLAAVAIEALSWVGSPAQDVLSLEKIALFRWEGVLGLHELSPEDREYLQRKAIEALANLGDLSSVERLRKGERNAKWTPGLERALFVTSEKIFWRMRWASEQ